MEIFGRERELARLDSFLESLSSGPAAFRLEGEPGIGKTTVWRAGVDAAKARGYRVLVSRPAESDSSLSYAGLADILGDVGDAILGELPEPQRAALEIALLRRCADGRPPDPCAVFAALRTTLELVATDRPTVVAVDDVQWLDGPSARALEFTGRRLDGTRVGLLTSARTDSGQPASTWFERSELFRLEPLSAAALHELVKSRLDWSMPRTTLLRLHDACAGNAFFALELSRVLDDAGRPDPRDAWPIPDDLRDLVDRRVRELPESVRNSLLRAAAVSQPTGEVFDPAALRIAQASGIVTVDAAGRVRFSHPLYASAIYAGSSPAHRRDLHRELAAAESDPEERARHLGMATKEPDEDVANVLDQAALNALSRGAPDTAAELQQRAFELTPGQNALGAARRALAAAELYLHVGALERVQRLAEGMVASPERRTRVHALRLLAQVHFCEKSVPDAMSLMKAAATAAGDEPELRSRVELDLAYACVNVSFDFAAAPFHARTALAHAELSGDRSLLSQALAVKVIADFLMGGGLDAPALERALILEDPDEDIPISLRPTLIGGCLAFYVGDYTRSRSLFYPLRARLRERGEDGDLSQLLNHIAWLECSAGDYPAARRLVAEGLAAASVTGSDSIAVLLTAQAALTEAHAGNAEACRKQVAATMAGIERTGHGVAAHWTLAAQGLLELSMDEPGAALRTFEPLMQHIEAEGLTDPIRATFLPDAIEALIRLEDLERADRLTAALADRGSELDRPWALATSSRCHALLLAANGDLEGARTAVEQALAQHERIAMPLELARTLIVKGQIERRMRQKAAARDSLEHALRVCERIDAALWAERARAELARLGVRRDPDELTATEERVAALAASGLTNREIAAAAFVSQKTVEANLSRIYRKLGIRSRAELGLRLAERASSRAPLA